MTMRVRIAPVMTTFVVALLAGAAQLGVAYGLGLLLWARSFNDSSADVWAGHLTWICWLAAASAVSGAVAGGKVARLVSLPDTVGWRIVIAAVGGVGAAVTIPLVMVPTRYAALSSGADPVMVAGRVTVVGVLVGAVVAFGVLLARPLAWNAIATVVWMWLVALGSVVGALRRGDDPEETRLGVWSYQGDAVPDWVPAVVPMLAAAFVIGFVVALLGRRVGVSRLGTAIAGTPGPLLVAVAYLVAGPGGQPNTDAQLLPYLAAPYAVIVGLIGSLLVAAGQRRTREQTADESTKRLEEEQGTRTLVLDERKPTSEKPAKPKDSAGTGGPDDEWLQQIRDPEQPIALPSTRAPEPSTVTGGGSTPTEKPTRRGVRRRQSSRRAGAGEEAAATAGTNGGASESSGVSPSGTSASDSSRPEGTS